MALIEPLSTKTFVKTRIPVRIPAEKINEIIDVLNSLVNDDGHILLDLLSYETGAISGAPLIGGFKPGSDIVFFDDFIDTYGVVDLALTSESDPTADFSEVADRGRWLATIVDSGGGNTETILGRPVDGAANAGAYGGWGEFRTCNADNDAVSCQLNGESFKLALGKELWFETRIFIEDVSETELFIGLSDTATDCYGAAGVGANNHVGFMLDGDGKIDFSVDEGGTQSKTDTGRKFVDGSIATLATANVVHKLAFHWDGASSVRAYVDDVLVVTKTDNGATILIPDGTCLTPSFTILTQGASDEAVFIDYIYVAQNR